MVGDAVRLLRPASEYADCLRDESRRTGAADTVSFPRSETEIRRLLAYAAQADLAVTAQGALTGITGGAVPDGGHAMNLSRMNRVRGMRRDTETDGFLLTVEPGLTLEELRKRVAAGDFETEGWTEADRRALASFRASGRHFFPPDPTETSASIGGMASCNASGARSFRYGATRGYVRAARVVLADGDVLDLQRGRERCAGRRFRVATAGGRVIEGRVPSYALPRVKNAAGYFAADDMDLLDLFIGSEGTLGLFSELEIRLAPLPAAVWGVTAFLASSAAAVCFVERIRSAPVRPAAVEFFDGRSLRLLQERQRANPSGAGWPDIPGGADAAVYVEYHGDGESPVEQAVLEMSATLEACGGDAGDTWLASDPRELERLKAFRHAVPEAVNVVIDERRKREPRLTKLGTDLAVPDEALGRVMEMYVRDLQALGLEFAVFGHIGDNHLHVNILPSNMREYEAGRNVYRRWAREAAAMGGTVSAEHGIGKLKREFLREMFGDRAVDEMRAVKRLFDPDGRLNRGNLLV